MDCIRNQFGKNLNLEDIWESTLTINQIMTKALRKKQRRKRNKLEAACPDELHSGSLERQGKTNRMRKPTLPKMVLSEAKKWLLEHGVQA